ncbi:MAG TPA: hypothetical protein VEU07_15125, partial [Candidatus Acidoferrum sp.]|nr:hypothetical protein [Candidatus Acidoferrum sp.]
MPIVCRAWFAFALATLFAVSPSRPRVNVISGSRPDGAATDLWLAILRRRLSPAEFDSVARLRRLRTSDEEAWARLVQDRSGEWPGAAAELEG